MTKQWKPGRETIALRPSRIRRDPVRLDPSKTIVPAKRSRERDIWTAMIGVTLFAVSVATIVAGVSMATNKNDSAATAAAPAPRFDYCGGARQQDCVVDGDTFFLGAEKVRLAGVDAPAARGARCRREARLAIDATVRLRRLLNDGTVSLAGAASAADADGAVRRRVEVNGADVGRMMVGAGLASELAYGTRSWC